MNDFEIKAALNYLSDRNIVKILNLKKDDKFFIYFSYKNRLFLTSFVSSHFSTYPFNKRIELIEKSIDDHIGFINNTFYNQVEVNNTKRISDRLTELICFHFGSMALIRFGGHFDAESLYWVVFHKVQKLLNDNYTNIGIYDIVCKDIDYDYKNFMTYLLKL